MFVPITFARDFHVGIYTHFSQRKSLIFNSYPNSPFKLNYVYKLANKDHHLLGTKVKYSLISREIFLLVKIHLATEHCLMVAILTTGGLGDTRESKYITKFIHHIHINAVNRHYYSTVFGWFTPLSRHSNLRDSGPAKQRVMSYVRTTPTF